MVPKSKVRKDRVLAIARSVDSRTGQEAPRLGTERRGEGWGSCVAEVPDLLVVKSKQRSASEGELAHSGLWRGRRGRKESWAC